MQLPAGPLTIRFVTIAANHDNGLIAFVGLKNYKETAKSGTASVIDLNIYCLFSIYIDFYVT